MTEWSVGFDPQPGRARRDESVRCARFAFAIINPMAVTSSPGTGALQAILPLAKAEDAPDCGDELTGPHAPGSTGPHRPRPADQAARDAELRL